MAGTPEITLVELPELNYKWERTEEALRQLAMSGANPFDDVALE